MREGISSTCWMPRNVAIASISTGKAVMRSDSSFTSEIIATPQQTRRSVDTSSIPSAVHRAVVGSLDNSLHATPRPAPKSSEIDACLYMFALCKHLQTICLDRRGIHCVVDADDVGRLPEAVCRMLGFMVCELVDDASKCSEPEIAGRTITVTLRRRGTTCICTISHHCLAPSCVCAQPRLRRAERFAVELRGSCVVRPMPERGITCIMFDVDLAERCFPEAIYRYRVGEAQAVQHHAVVPE